MKKFFKLLWEAITMRRICQFCEGIGWVQVGYRDSMEERVKCSVCAGRGIL